MGPSSRWPNCRSAGEVGDGPHRRLSFRAADVDFRRQLLAGVVKYGDLVGLLSPAPPAELWLAGDGDR